MLVMAGLLLVCLCSVGAQRHGFAIVVDPKSYSEAKSEVDDYAKAIDDVNKLKVYLVVDRWGVPDSIRKELMRLYSLKDEAIVGAVFVGDIPIPMIRDAQYLCSAFKMSQKMPWRESSVPSDRFYDDFGLKFRFLKKDDAEPYFYYSLTEEGNQYVRPNIFSGRIRPTDTGGFSRYEKLKSYLKKATYRKRHPERLNSVFIYTGSGSLSESKVAHIDEMASMREHFPQIYNNTGAFSYMDYSDAPYIKTKMMNELMRPDLGLALMHHHGDYDTQYLSSYPKPDGASAALEYLRHCYASRLNRAIRFEQDLDSVKWVIRERDGIPMAWLDSLTAENLPVIDSIENSRMNLTLGDFSRYDFRPNCLLAMFDACYNGSFHREDCIANEYIFQNGRTVAGLGATVNVLQDKWPDRYAGLLDQGLMVGCLNQLNPELEMHLIGDPTLFFMPITDKCPMDDDTNVFASLSFNPNEMLASADGEQWRTFCDSANADIQALCIRRLADSGELSSAQLLDVMDTHDYGIVRLEAYLAIRSRGYNKDFVEAVIKGADDNFELLQRFAVNDMIKCGDPEMIPTFARLLCQNNTSARVAFNATQGIQFFPEKKLRCAMNKALDSLSHFVVEPEKYKETVMNEANKYFSRWDEDIDRLCADSLSEKRAMMQADFMRIYLPPHKAAQVAAYTEHVKDANLQIALLDALGWHRLCYQVGEVRQSVERIKGNKRLPDRVRAQAMRTLKRLTP